jgi:acetoin utilization deacetylase AcuC-like enzyme
LALLFFTHPSGLEHETGPGHPERIMRLQSILKAVEAADIWDLERRTAPRATLEQLRRVHPEPYPLEIHDAIPAAGLRRLDPDTVVGPRSYEAALHAAGAVCAAVAAVTGGEATRRAFCAMRPPGHHAEPDRAMGFCLFNSIAIGAMEARARLGVGKIAIYDFDVHHGNGTQAAFWADPDTLYLSTHEWPLYPGTGAAEETGVRRNIVNVPLAAGTDSQGFRAAVERRILPAIDAFKPELVMVSAGFDAHRADPLANLMLVEEDYDWVTRQLAELADLHAHGRIVAVLEGGYDLLALARSTVAHLRALAYG